MPECSLCGGPLSEGGGAVLFTDARGIPFEVCGVCEEKIELLHRSQDEAEAGRALEYISDCARSLGRRDVYDSLAEFIQRSMPSEHEAAEAAPEAGEPSAAEARGDAGGARRFRPYLLGLILIGILALVFVLCGAPLR